MTDKAMRQPPRISRRWRTYCVACVLWVVTASLLTLAGCATARGYKLLEELGTPLPETKATVFKEFDKLGPSANPALHRGLGHMDPMIRQATREYLIKHQGEKAIPFLIQTLRSRSELARRNAIRVLGKLAPKGASQVVPALQKARKDPEAWVRAAAYKALASYGATKPATLVKALNDPSPAIRIRAARQLASRAPKGGQPAKRALEKLATDANPKIRQIAVTGLKRFGLNTMVGPILPRIQRKLGLKEYHFHYGKRGAGQFSMSRLQAVIKRHWPEIKQCHKRHTGKGLLVGKLVVRWVIYKTGDVLATNIIYTSIRYKPFVSCIMHRARTWQFPKPKGELVVASYPFLIQAKP